MSVKEGCFLIGIALLRISMAADLAAWASAKKRPDEAKGFLQHASMDISQALAGGFLTEDDAEKMRESIESHEKAIARGDTEESQDRLADLSVRAHDIAFQKVVDCECK